MVPILWLFSPHILYLIFIQIFAGFVWSGFSLASANFIFDAVTPPKRARCVAYHGLVNGIFVFIGSLAGGYAAGHLPQSISIGHWNWEPSFMLQMVFMISGLMRLAAAGIFLQKFEEVRSVEQIRHRHLLFRVSHIKPIEGATFSLITGLFQGERENEKKLRSIKNLPCYMKGKINMLIPLTKKTKLLPLSKAFMQSDFPEQIVIMNYRHILL
jgi:MFS family permease